MKNKVRGAELARAIEGVMSICENMRGTVDTWDPNTSKHIGALVTSADLILTSVIELGVAMAKLNGEKDSEYSYYLKAKRDADRKSTRGDYDRSGASLPSAGMPAVKSVSTVSSKTVAIKMDAPIDHKDLQPDSYALIVAIGPGYTRYKSSDPEAARSSLLKWWALYKKRAGLEVIDGPWLDDDVDLGKPRYNLVVRGDPTAKMEEWVLQGGLSRVLYLKDESMWQTWRMYSQRNHDICSRLRSGLCSKEVAAKVVSEHSPIPKWALLHDSSYVGEGAYTIAPPVKSTRSKPAPAVQYDSD